MEMRPPSIDRDKGHNLQVNHAGIGCNEDLDVFILAARPRVSKLYKHDLFSSSMQ